MLNLTRLISTFSSICIFFESAFNKGILGKIFHLLFAFFAFSLAISWLITALFLLSIFPDWTAVVAVLITSVFLLPLLIVISIRTNWFSQTSIGEINPASNYYEYLKSPEWGEKRRLALQRANFSCERCGETGVPLEVHHRHYRTLGEESEDDLKALCRKCHLEIELKKEKRKRNAL